MSENGDNDINTDTNNKIVPVRDNSKYMAKKERRQYQAELNLAEFAKYYFARWSPELICKTLKIHRSTYYEYVSKLSKQQKQMIATENKAYYDLEVARYQNDLNYLINKCKATIEKKDVSEDERLMAMSLMAEIGKQAIMLFTNGSIEVIRKMPYIIRKALDENKNTVEIKIEAAPEEEGEEGEDVEPEEDEEGPEEE